MIALGLVGCGPTAPAPDASIDAGPPRLALTIDGPDFTFVGEEACWTARHEGGPDAIVEVVWADGTLQTLDVGVSTACHTYAVPGPLVLGMSVEARGMHADATRLVHVVFEPSARRPTSSSTVAYDAATGTVWTVEPDADVAVAIDGANGESRERVAVGDGPRTVAVAGARTLVACQHDGTLHVLGPADEHVTVDFGAGAGLFAVLVDPRDPSRAWVTLQATGELARVDLEPTPSIGGRWSVGRDPRAIAMRDDGMIVLTRWRSTLEAASIVVIDASDPSAPSVLPDLLLPRETGRDSDTDSDGVLSFLGSIVIAPDGGRAVLGALKANTVAGLSRTGLPLTTQTTARGAIAEIFLGAGAGEPAEDSIRTPLDDNDYVSSLVFSPMGETIYLTVEGSEVVLARDSFSFDTIGSIDDVGHSADGLALDASGTTLFVHAALSRELRAYDVSDLGTNPLPTWTARTVETEPLAADVLAGAILFARSRDERMSRTRYLSCASCHRDGESDGLVWDFTQRGEGLRRTIPLRGRAGTAHGPLHWTANFDEVQDFEHDIRTGQGGSGFLPDALFHVGTRDTTLGDSKAGLSPELDALAAYVTSLASFGTSPLRRDGDATWEAARARGEATFHSASAGCDGCHAGPRYTDSAFTTPATPILHDVGTLGPDSGTRLGEPLTGLDTPTLRGLWSHRAFLHDGSAATLEDVLVARNPDDLHGTTSTLSPAEIDDLVTFLLSLDDDAP